MKNFDLTDYNQPTKIFWAGLLAIAAPLVGWAILASAGSSPLQLVALCALALGVFAAGLFPVRVPGASRGATASAAFVFAGLIYLGIAPAIFLAALDAFLCDYRRTKNVREWMTDSAINGIGAAVGGTAFYLILRLSGELGWSPVALQAVSVQWFVVALSSAALLFFLTNSILNAALLALKNEENIFAVFSRGSLGSAWGVFAGLVFAGVVYEIVLVRNVAAPFLVFPFVILPYFAYRTYCCNIEDESSEAIEDSRLHLAAIEALSNAIEAREQMTPGHVRRVQIYAVELGKVLKLSKGELKALELAALLHGIGKLAVPDYILNKPGGLTIKEKERVKLHPLVGAEVVEAVAFPYPVADAVRYYNECWDGSGYPDNLRADEIPMTARVLGLADAYDTMREERPYRQACSREEARRMLLAGAGTRFDGKLVDLFLRHLSKFEAAIIAADLPLDGVTGAADSDSAAKPIVPPYLEKIRQTNREVFAVYELARLSSATFTLTDLLPFLSKKVQELVPSDTCAIYLYDDVRAVARAVHTSGKNAAFMRERVVQLGVGAIGFALKNEKAVSSVNPSLDLTGDYAAAVEDYTTMAVLPLRAGKRLVGALAVYSETLLSYDEEHLRLLETTAHVVADSIARTMQHEESEARAITDALTGLPNARGLQLQFEKEVSRSQRTGRPFQFLMLDLDEFKKVNDTFGHKVGDNLLCEISKILRDQLRDYDFLARYAGDEFVAVLPEISGDRVQEVCQRIEQAVLDFVLPVNQVQAARVGISVGAASYPQHGETLEQILVAADQNMYSEKATHRHRNSGALQMLDAQIFTQSVN